MGAQRAGAGSRIPPTQGRGGCRGEERGATTGGRMCMRGRGEIFKGRLRGRSDARNGRRSVEGMVRMRVGTRRTKVGCASIRPDVRARGTPKQFCTKIYRKRTRIVEQMKKGNNFIFLEIRQRKYAVLETRCFSSLYL
jgi:hypothetical protein